MGILDKVKSSIKKAEKIIKNYIKSTLEFAGEHKQIVKMTGMATGIIIFSVLFVTLFTTGYEVYLGGEKVAVVTDKADFVCGFDEANRKITDIAGKGYGIVRLPKYVFTVAAKSAISDKDEIVRNVMARSDAVTDVYVISVDGSAVATAKTEQEAKGLIDEAASVYDGENRRILNDVKIVCEFVKVGSLSGHYEAIDAISEVLKVQTEKTSVYSAELLYDRVENPTEELYVNEEKVSAEGKNGVMEVTAKVTEINGKVSDTAVVSSKVIEEPVSEVVMVGTAQIPSVGTGSFVQPYYGTITSRFGARWGRTHKGTDICGDIGDPIVAADNGIVLTAEYQDNGYGNIIILDHQNGVQTWYAHLDKIDVAAGDVVQKGNKIGELGNTGYSTGPHLHFEVRENGAPVNPAAYLESLQ